MVKDQDGEVWGRMIVDLPFPCETDFYEEDVVPGYEIIRWDSLYFLSLSLVGAERKKPKKQQKNTTIRIVPQRRFVSQAYKSPPNAPPPTKYTRARAFKKKLITIQQQKIIVHHPGTKNLFLIILHRHQILLVNLLHHKHKNHPHLHLQSILLFKNKNLLHLLV